MREKSENREITKKGKVCDLSAFILSEMGNHWRILNKVTWIGLCFIMISVTIKKIEIQKTGY